ncbi:MAG: hypothetical protein LBN24_06855 [Mediterranea sp.]|nr:hypothetical protein [Mediterranea sp.]
MKKNVLFALFAIVMCASLSSCDNDDQYSIEVPTDTSVGPHSQDGVGINPNNSGKVDDAAVSGNYDQSTTAEEPQVKTEARLRGWISGGALSFMMTKNNN